ncbi:hypothetical protein BU23DRAFT_579057 [Bimuria novae-zelandiae CBS 107.79]|uniref:HTH psq-type domain-containing protein n=1 Tax=Bimuria novae-zelandiae CBS 107.79 TaxID=1447943 RepID=A0A6A5VGM9_9PLEO|nr:hypothetical protein BU23DRAFT_579057 [Bimuria novae-zelandiae CBS 107.79]
MAPINDVIKDLKSRDLGEHFTLREVAKKYKVNYLTLGRRWRGLELIQYIIKLIERGLPSTRKIIRNFLSKTTTIDRVRHLANSKLKYRLYFELLHRKITKYHLKAQDIYNIDKKGFLISLIGRSKRIFSRPCYCVNRSSLPLSLIYVAKKGAI